MLSFLTPKSKAPALRRTTSSTSTSSSTSSTSSSKDPDPKTVSLNESLETLSAIFPNVECDEFRRLLTTFSEESRVHIITEMLLKRSKDGGTPVRPAGKLEAWERFRPEAYIEAARRLLYKEFKGLSKSTIRAVMAENNSDYSRTRSTLADIAHKSWRFSITSFFRGTRALIPSEPTTLLTGCDELDAELFTLTAPSREKQIHADHAIAQLLNEAEHAAASELVECECCYGDYAWDEIAACSEGHFFCHGCLVKSVHEGLYGQGRNLVGEMCSVRCLSSSAAPACAAFVPAELLQAVLPGEVWVSLEDKMAAEALERSGLELVKCPFCMYAEVVPVVEWGVRREAKAVGVLAGVVLVALIPAVLGMVMFLLLALGTFAVQPLYPNARDTFGPAAAWSAIARLLDTTAKKIQRRRRGMMFRCFGRCKRSSCVGCGKEWAPFHRCYEKEEDGVRIFVEKAMADAVKRTCPLCHISFIKSDGCNKLTCPCGYIMCYVCRADIRGNGYTHFCQHFRQIPGKPCGECEACDLYVQEDEEKVVKAAAEKAEREYFRRFGKPAGWVYRRMEGSVLEGVMGEAGVPVRVGWGRWARGWAEWVGERVLV